jgi:hypothetical protein
VRGRPAAIRRRKPSHIRAIRARVRAGDLFAILSLRARRTLGAALGMRASSCAPAGHASRANPDFSQRRARMTQRKPSTREDGQLSRRSGRESTDDLPSGPPGLSISFALSAAFAIRDSDRVGLVLADFVVSNAHSSDKSGHAPITGGNTPDLPVIRQTSTPPPT